MHTKKNAAFIAIVVLSMLILAYITFVSVYEQILSKGNGFFNVILFGVVLILVFIFITLLARVITINPSNQNDSIVLSFLVTLGILAIFAIFTWVRLQYTSSVTPSESYVYRAAEYLSADSLSEGSEIHTHLLGFPADFCYSILVSILFKIFGVTTAIYTIANISMMLISAAFLYSTVKLLSSRACAAFAIILFMFMPNNTFIVYSYSSELFAAANFLIALYLYQVLIYRRFKSGAAPVIIAVLLGIFSGIAISAEPVLLIAFIVLSVWVYAAGRQKTKCIVIPHVLSLVITAAVSFYKSILLKCSFIDVIKGWALCFVPTFIRDPEGEGFTVNGMLSAITGRLDDPSRFMNESYYFLTNSEGKSFSTNQALWLDISDQAIYIFMLILSVMCIVYIIRVMYDKIMPSISLIIALFIGQVLGGMNRVNELYFVSIFFIVGCCALYYMYLNHHNDYAVYITNAEINRDMDIKRMTESEVEGEAVPGSASASAEGASELSEEELARARALIFVGEDNELYDMIKREERTQRLNNPVAATRISTSVNEEGEYDSVEESIEYFDEPDEIVAPKPVAEVTAIPATRPVDVVKPVLADEYFDEPDNLYTDNNSDIPVITPPVSIPDYLKFTPKEVEEPAFEKTSLDEPVSDINTEAPAFEKPVIEEPVFDEPQPVRKNDIQDNQDNGFVFRNRKPTGAAAAAGVAESAADRKSSAYEDSPAIKAALGLDDKPKGKRTEASVKPTDPSAVKPGAPLPNPLPVPKKHVNKDLDFDLDISGDDDFDI